MPRFYIPHAGEPRRGLVTDTPIVSEIWEASVSDGSSWREAHSAFASFDPSRYGYEALDDLWKARHDSNRGFLRAQDIAFAPVSDTEMFEPVMYRGASAELTLFLLALWSASGAPRDTSFDHIFASLNLSDPRESIYFIVEKVRGFVAFASQRPGARCVMFIGADHHEEVLESNTEETFTLLRFDSGEALEAAMASSKPVVVSVSRARLDALYSEFEVLWDANLAGTCHNCGETGTVGLRCLSMSCREHGFYFLDPTLASGTPGMRTGKILRRQGRRAYLLGDVFAQGSAASVYRAYRFDPQGRVNTDMVYAVKVLRGRHPSETSAMYTALEQGFAREHAMLTQLARRGHAAHVVELAGPSNITRKTRTEPLYLGLRYLPNARSLDTWIQARAMPMRSEDAWRMITPIFGVLTRVHEFGAHGDVSSSNMMILGEDSTDLVLIDFGHARLDQNSWDTESLTPLPPSGPHAAPEAPGVRPEQQDIYGLALVLTELLTGRVLVESPLLLDKAPRSAFDVLDVCLEDGRLTPASLPRPIKRVLRKALMWDPERRYESMKAFRDAFTMALIHPQASRGPVLRALRAVAILTLFTMMVASGWLYAWKNPPIKETKLVRVVERIPTPGKPSEKPTTPARDVVEPGILTIDLSPEGDSATQTTVLAANTRTKGHMTHVRGPLKPGTYTITIEHKDFGVASKKVSVTSGHQRIRFSLTELEGYQDPLANMETLNTQNEATQRRGSQKPIQPKTASLVSPKELGIVFKYNLMYTHDKDAAYIETFNKRARFLRRGLQICVGHIEKGSLSLELHLVPNRGLSHVTAQSNQDAITKALSCVKRQFRSLTYPSPLGRVLLKIQMDFEGKNTSKPLRKALEKTSRRYNSPGSD